MRMAHNLCLIFSPQTQEPGNQKKKKLQISITKIMIITKNK